MITRFFRKIFTADVMGLLLVVAALNTLVFGISASLRTTDTRYFYYACMIAALTSLGLNKIKCNGIQASAWIVALGVAGVWIIGANLTVP